MAEEAANHRAGRVNQAAAFLYVAEFARGVLFVRARDRELLFLAQHPIHLLRTREVQLEREATKTVGTRAEVRFVVRGGVESDDDPVRPLEEPVDGLARRILGPAERTQELGHALHVGAGEREEVELRDGQR